MTAPEVSPAADRQSAACDLYLRSVADSAPLSGAELGRRFDRSPSWGKAIIQSLSNGREAVDDTATSPAVTTAVRRTTALALTVVAVVAAAISYSHLHALALAAGEGAWQAALVPLSIDGMLIVASLTALVRRRVGQPARLAWGALLLGVVASVAANIASAEPTIEGRLVAAWAPVALLLTVELALQQSRRQA